MLLMCLVFCLICVLADTGLFFNRPDDFMSECYKTVIVELISVLKHFQKKRGSITNSFYKATIALADSTYHKKSTGQYH